jgi:lipopolysaccharide biosynthesis regulator YciM
MMAIYKNVESLEVISYKGGTNEFDNGVLFILEKLDDLPVADVEEVRHGEWIKKNGLYVCSECGYTCPYDVVGDNIEYWECLYCRHCGTKMKGDN